MPQKTEPLKVAYSNLSPETTKDLPKRGAAAKKTDNKEKTNDHQWVLGSDKTKLKIGDKCFARFKDNLEYTAEITKISPNGQSVTIMYLLDQIRKSQKATTKNVKSTKSLIRFW